MSRSMRHIAADTLAPAGNQERQIFKSGTTEQIILVLLAADRLAPRYTDQFAERLRGKTTRDTCRRIHAFVQDNITYREDPPGIQDIQSPSQLFESGQGDCKSFSLFCGSVLRNLGIRYFYRFVGFDNEPEVTHVYVVALDDQGAEIFLDAVPPIRFDEEASHTLTKDFATKESMQPTASVGAVHLSAPPCSPSPLAMLAVGAGLILLFT